MAWLISKHTHPYLPLNLRAVSDRVEHQLQVILYKLFMSGLAHYNSQAFVGKSLNKQKHI